MKKIVIVSVLVVVLGVAALISFGGLSWLDSTGLRGQEKVVESRVRGYWQARVDQDLEKQVEYLHPLQGTVADSGMLVTEGFEINSITVDGDEAIADLVVHSRLKHPILSARERTVEMQTKWVRLDDGKWYRALAPQTVFEIIQNEQGNWTPPTAEQNEALEPEPATSTQ